MPENNSVIAANDARRFGPIPRMRSRRDVLHVSIITVFTVVFFYGKQQDDYIKDIKWFMFTFAALSAATIVGEFIRRSCLVFEEKNHLESRYHGSWRKMLNAVYGYQGGIAFVVFLVIVLALIDEETTPMYQTNSRSVDIIIVTAIIPSMFYVFNLTGMSGVERDELGEQSKLNVAHGLAWSYYFGYLKIILPELVSTIEKSERWEDALSKGKLLPKVFALIPKSGFIVDEICDDRRKIIYVDKEDDDVLPPLFRKRGGIVKRVYQNTVYTIKDENEEEPHYAILEYVTPVDAIYQMSKHREAGISEEDKEMQIRLFYRYLSEIIESQEDCRGRCVLVPISGKENHDELRHILLDELEKARR